MSDEASVYTCRYTEKHERTLSSCGRQPENPSPTAVLEDSDVDVYNFLTGSSLLSELPGGVSRGDSFYREFQQRGPIHEHSIPWDHNVPQSEASQP